MKGSISAVISVENKTRELQTMTADEFLAIAEDRFGKDAKQWKFVCPRCGTVQCGQDFIDAGISKDQAIKYIAFSCIGRLVDGVGCDWTLGGLFQIHQLEVIDQDGEKHPRFLIAEPEDPGK